ncbi:unnamed protein product, partial [Mesorhabditis belari]|uniref:Uncharacterized protein n=1 Tax=Mesorhabditis belari TaxID=2138241 RepID=A0AAF3EAY8_9BILA
MVECTSSNDDYSHVFTPTRYNDNSDDQTQISCAERLVSILDEVQQNLEAEHEYHTPKNVFIPEMIMSRSLIHQEIIDAYEYDPSAAGFQMSTIEPFYGTIDNEEKILDHQPELIDFTCSPALPTKSHVPFPVRSDQSLDGLLEELRFQPESSNKFYKRIQTWRECLALDTYDAGLTIAFIVVIFVGVFGGSLRYKTNLAFSQVRMPAQ